MMWFVSPTADESAWARLRAEFPVTATRAYLFAGGMAPLSMSACSAIERYAALSLSDPVRAYREYPREQAELLRAEVAAIIGARSVDIAIIDSTSRGNNLAVQMLAARSGANVVVDSTTYPTALYPWLARGDVEVRRALSSEGVPSPAELHRLVDGRTVAVSVSHVCRLTGFRHDLRQLAEVAHANGAVLVVDAAQSAGVVELDVEKDGIDFLSFGAMKWLLGTPGIAFFYVRPALQDVLMPPHLGGGAHTEGGGLVLPAGGSRHELSSFAWSGLEACREGLRLLASIPGEAVRARVLELSGRVIDGLLARGARVLTSREPAQRAGIVAFECERPGRLVRFLRERSVDVWGSEKAHVVRADPHVFNDGGDIERFLEDYSCWQLSDN